MTTRIKRTNLLITVARAIMFGIIFVAIHVLMLYVPMPIDDVLGILRGFTVAVLAKLAESVFYRLAREIIPVVEGEKIS